MIAKKKSDLEKIEKEDTKNKIDLEDTLRPNIDKFLRKINNDFYKNYIADETVITTNDYKIELTALLLLMYGKISNKFKYNIRESFDDRLDNIMDAKIDIAIANESKKIANLRSDLILATTDREITNTLNNTISEFIEKDSNINNIAIAVATKKALDEKVAGRASVITTSEVQTAAETSKDVEKKTLVSNSIIIGGIALATQLKDIWVATLDEKTRMAHIMANGQEKNIFGYFNVGGESLAYPGDPSGSAANIINCRCSMVSLII